MEDDDAKNCEELGGGGWESTFVKNIYYISSRHSYYLKALDHWK